MDNARMMGLPGEPAGDRLVDRVLRVDLAGEYGAVRIYEGQLAVLGREGRMTRISWTTRDRRT